MSVLKGIDYQITDKHWRRRVIGRAVSIQANVLVFDNGRGSKTFSFKNVRGLPIYRKEEIY